MIKYTKSTVAVRPTFRTEKFGNLLSDTYQGEVNQSPRNDWTGWLTNYSDPYKSEFKLGFKSKAAATKWVNEKLAEVGVNVK